MPTENQTASCPYPGLRAFFTDEQEWYFGRESHVNDALTRLEDSRFLAIVGSSGSGKSSLVFAGLIPALHAGELAGSLYDEAGNPALWSIIDFKPGNAPLEELAKAITAQAIDHADPLMGGYVRASLHSGDLGLIEALKVASHLQPDREVLIYVDQFEELFRFGERSSVEEQENAQRFSRLLVAAAEQREVRLHLLLSMRSEFIGECERFPGLPELVSRSQFLTPRLNRKQLEQSLGLPATTVGWKVAPDALNALLNDCSNSPDQLPLAQHVLRRMWTRAAAAGRIELTLDDYRQTGGIRDSLAIHGEEILSSLPQPDGPRVARLLFMALCDQRDEGPLIRRLSSKAEVELIAGSMASLVGQVVDAFGKNDPGFIREDNGWLDVRHEAVLRQWPLIAKWREEEAASVARLRGLADAAGEFSKSNNDSYLWTGNKLQRSLDWLKAEGPSAAWASRHFVDHWESCLGFLDQSEAKQKQAEEVTRQREEEARAAAEQNREDKRLRQRNLRFTFLTILGVALVSGMVMTVLWRKSVIARKESDAAKKVLQLAQTDLVGAAKGLAGTIDQLAPPLVESAKKSLTSFEEERAKLIEVVLRDTPVSAPPDKGLLQSVRVANNKAEESISLLEKLQTSLQSILAIPSLKSAEMDQESGELAASILALRTEFKRLRDGRGFIAPVNAAISGRIKSGDEALQSFSNTADLQRRAALALSASAQVSAIEDLAQAAMMIGVPESDLAGVGATSYARLDQAVTEAKNAAAQIPDSIRSWSMQNSKGSIDHRSEHRITCVRFVPAVGGRPMLLASSGEDKTIRFWKIDGTPVATWSTSSAINDIAINREGDALAAASNGSTVRVLRLKGGLDGGKIQAEAFERHSDSITDVAFDMKGSLIASASGDRTVRIFHAEYLKETYASRKLDGIVTSVAFSPTGISLVVSGADDGGVRLHSANRPAESFVFEPKMGAPARRPEFSHDGEYVIAASGDRFVRLWESREPFALKHAHEHPAPLSQATFRPDPPSGRYPVITCSSNGEVRAWTNALDRGAGVGLTPSHSGAVVSASWNDDGSVLATVGGSEVIVWKWPPGQDLPSAVVRIGGLAEGTSSAQFSPDSSTLVTYGGNSVALIWDLSALGL